MKQIFLISGILLLSLLCYGQENPFFILDSIPEPSEYDFCDKIAEIHKVGSDKQIAYAVKFESGGYLYTGFINLDENGEYKDYHSFNDIFWLAYSTNSYVCIKEEKFYLDQKTYIKIIKNLDTKNK